jgi:hypothetical protein
MEILKLTLIRYLQTRKQRVKELKEVEKEQASWKGPYTIIDKVSPVDYKIKINGKTEKIFHVNMLKLWYERTDDIENSRNEVLKVSCKSGHWFLY